MLRVKSLTNSYLEYIYKSYLTCNRICCFNFHEIYTFLPDSTVWLAKSIFSAAVEHYSKKPKKKKSARCFRTLKNTLGKNIAIWKKLLASNIHCITDMQLSMRWVSWVLPRLKRQPVSFVFFFILVMLHSGIWNGDRIQLVYFIYGTSIL